MAGAKWNYPMMSVAAWQGLREQFRTGTPARVDRTWVATVLGITERSAANLLGPMRSFGLIDPSGQPTERASRWSADDGLPAACREMVADVYPEGLRDAFPDPGRSRDSVIQWFSQNAGVGRAGASKMASTYELVVESGRAAGSQPAAPSPSAPQARPIARAEVPTETVTTPAPAAAPPVTAPDRDARFAASGGPVLRRDIHVHIAADASAEQIDQIFASMARHFRAGE